MSLNETINNLGDSIINLVDKKRHGTLGLEQGDVGYDKEVWADIYKYKHSTFDRSKFEIVGSPTITDDGVASGFTNSNYLDTKFLINTDVVIKGSFTLSSKTSSTVGKLFSIGNASDNNGLRFVVATSGFLQMAQLQTWINYVWEVKYVIDIPIFYEVIISGTSVNLKLTQNNTEIANVSDTVPNNISGTISLGRELATGSIDLKQFSITVDGTEVFNGNKTGIDVIKEDNYTNENLLISDDGIIMGTTNYPAQVVTPTIPFSTFNNWEIIFPVNFPNTNTQYILIESYPPNSFDIRLYRTQINTLSFLQGDGSNWFTLDYLNVASPFAANTLYWVKYGFSGTQYYLKYSTEKDGNYTTICQYALTSKIRDCKFLISRTGGSSTSLCTWDYLNNFKIYSNGNLVYQPCLKIPYTLSKTGSKIVDEIYRNRVIDLYEQKGCAPYYTVDNGGKEDFYKVGSPRLSNKILSNSTVKSNNSVQIRESRLRTVTSKVFETRIKVSTGDFLKEGKTLANFAESGLFWGFVQPGDPSGTFHIQLMSHWDGAKRWIGSGDFPINTWVSLRWEYDPIKGVRGILCNESGDKYISTWNSSGNIQNLTENYINLLHNTYDNFSVNDAVHIDLANTKLYVDGELIWTPYTRPSFTLPMGDTYGVLSAKANSSEISRYAMPSDKYDDLTTPGEDTTITAPANGYIQLNGLSDATNQWITLYNDTSILQSCSWAASSNNVVACNIPVKKGDVVRIRYSVPAITGFRFIYAEGEV